MSSLSPQQEAFCREYIKNGGNATDAYRTAGYSTAQSVESQHTNASKLLTKVMPRIEQLRLATQKRHNITIERLTEMLEAALRKAMEEPKGASAAVSAVMGIGKLHGLIVDKKEVTRKRDAGDWTDDELYEIARMGSARATEATGSTQEPDSVH